MPGCCVESKGSIAGYQSYEGHRRARGIGASSAALHAGVMTSPRNQTGNKSSESQRCPAQVPFPSPHQPQTREV